MVQISSYAKDNSLFIIEIAIPYTHERLYRFSLVFRDELCY